MDGKLPYETKYHFIRSITTFEVSPSARNRTSPVRDDPPSATVLRFLRVPQERSCVFSRTVVRAMQDLSLHILDITENSIAAGATEITIVVNEDSRANVLTLTIQDNGSGLEEETLKKVTDPFFTTKESKRIGLGVSMLAHATREADGTFDIQSKKGEGTKITATFVYNHIDRKPLGNITDTIISLIATAGSRLDLVYKHYKNKKSFVLDTKKIKQDLDGVPLSNPEVLDILRKQIQNELAELDGKNKKE